LSTSNRKSIFNGRKVEEVPDAVGILHFARFEANAR